MNTADGDEVDLRSRRILLLMFVGLVAIVAIGLAFNNGNDAPDARREPSPLLTLPEQTSTSVPSNVERPDSAVPPVECKGILTFAEVSDALGVADNPALDGGSTELSRDEVCTETMSADERYFVQVSPSGPSDFESGAELIGVEAVPVDGVGVRAIWFGGPDSDDGGIKGVLAVQ